MLSHSQPAQRSIPRLSTLSLALLAAVTFQAQAAPGPAELAEETEFDLQILKAKGVDSKIAEWFRHAPRFTPGESTVTLTVNGNLRGKLNARFDDEGQLCVNNEFVKQAGLIKPPGFIDDGSCFDLKTAWPQTELTLDPSQGSVSLVVPAQAVAATGAVSGNWQHGGVAGLFNYDAQYMDSRGATSGVNFMQLGSEVGFNFSDWIVRSKQTFSRLNGEDSLQHQVVYAQRSFVESKKVLQAGQVSLSNSLFGTGQVLGFQLFPEAALQGNNGGPGLVEGIADSQSVVEVRQSNVLVYRTTVPAGPFRLQGFPLLNTRNDLSVTLTGSDGGQRQFIVPASALLLNGNSVAPGLSFGAGKLEQSGSSKAPLVGTLASGWVLSPHATLNAGLLGSSLYSASGLSLDSQPFDSTLLTLQATAARDASYDNNGLSAVASLSYQATERVGLSANASQQTAGYRELSDALLNEPIDNTQSTRNQFGVGIGWSQPTLGSLTLSASRLISYDGSNTDYLRGSWSRQFGQAFLGASLEQDSGSRDSAGETRFYLSVNVAFGNGRSVNSYLNTSGSSSRSGLRYSDRGWSLSGDRDLNTQRTSGSASADRATSVSLLSGGLSHSSDNYTSFSARASGGAVAHAGGITLSPYRISDTFGIAKVGEEAGVRLETSGGSTWTGRNGYAVLPSLNSFRRSTIQIDTRSLDKSVDISNAFQETEAARGSVSSVSFDVVRTRRVLVDVQDAQGKPLPRGASVFNAQDSFVTVVSERGSVFIPDISAGNQFDVQVSGRTICSFTLTLPEQAAANQLYESASAQCR